MYGGYGIHGDTVFTLTPDLFFFRLFLLENVLRRLGDGLVL